ncbi:ArdC family protein [Methylocystis suflitae]|uniref:ArdC family protein n=1 Tax=Methylocystis suflitae TaxID=2951405 RepID=UPI003898E497
MQSIIDELEQGAALWVKPWKDGGRIGIMPANAVTGHHYRDNNVPILWHATDTHGFPLMPGSPSSRRSTTARQPGL